MSNYEKPVLEMCPEYSEAIYMASGANAKDFDDNDSEGACNSIYMKGVYHPANTNGLTYMEKHGCQTCPGGNHNGCKLQANGYKADENGKNRPNWEKQGHQPDELFKN